MKQFVKCSVSAFLCLGLIGCGQKAETKTVTGEAEGYGGTITAKVTLEGDKITALELTGEKETPSVGGEALKTLQENIVKAGTIDGVDVVSGATWTSNGVFDAVAAALGEKKEDEGNKGGTSAVSSSGLNQGIGHVSTPRLGPGKDSADNPVYSFNEVFAYVITDNEGRIVDLECDILEVITPNHDGAQDNFIAGWPGQSYAYDEAHDGSVITVLDETEDTWTAELSGFTTKRGLGNDYKMKSGTWTQEMDTYEEFFKGMTKDEVRAAEENLFSDLNGRPLNGNSDKDEDVAKAGKLTDEQKAQIDTLSGATMSVNDAHGDLITAICNAIDNAEPIEGEGEIASIGLGIDTVYRLGPGKDEQDVPVYSFNIAVAGTALDKDGKIIETTCDVLEIISPNHDSAHDNRFTGWPSNSYNYDINGDATAYEQRTQTEDSFVEEISAYNTKRALGNDYKMKSGTWTQEMNIYENFFRGMNADEIKTAEETLFSDLNGRPLNGNSDKDEDVAKAGKLTDEQKAQIDTLSGATMSVNDAHGNLIAAVLNSITSAK